MKIVLKAQLRKGRSGIEARNPVLKLTSHGSSQEEAIESLKRGILAWCYGLQTIGKLEDVLQKRQIDFQQNGNSMIVEIDDILWVNDLCNNVVT